MAIQDKKQRELLELAQAGGTDKDLVILEKIQKIEDDFDAKSQEFADAVEKLRDDFPDLDKVLESVRGPQGVKGEKGEDGFTPVKGKDYFTDEELKQIKLEVTPKKGIDYKDGRSPLTVGKTPPSNPQKGDLWYQD